MTPSTRAEPALSIGCNDGAVTWKRATLAAVVVAIVVAVLGVVLVQNPFADPALELPSSVDGEEVPPVADAPLTRIAAAGDTGTGDAAELATARQMTSQGRHGAPYDALVLLGDIVYEDGDSALVDHAVTEPFAPLLDNGTELLPVLGNHDYRSGEQEEIMSELGQDRSWYVERIGPVRMIVLDSQRVEEPRQTQWLAGMLAASQPAGTWTIAAMHHPAYSAGYHGSTESVQDAWAPLFAHYDVPLVLAGHDHDYQRSKPIDGVTYVVSGGGAKLRPTGQEDFTAVSSSTLHYLDLLVYEDRIIGRAIDQHGKLVDAFTITQ